MHILTAASVFIQLVSSASTVSISAASALGKRRTTSALPRYAARCSAVGTALKVIASMSSLNLMTKTSELWSYLLRGVGRVK